MRKADAGNLPERIRNLGGEGAIVSLLKPKHSKPVEHRNSPKKQCDERQSFAEYYFCLVPPYGCVVYRCHVRVGCVAARARMQVDMELGNQEPVIKSVMEIPSRVRRQLLKSDSQVDYCDRALTLSNKTT